MTFNLSEFEQVPRYLRRQYIEDRNEQLDKLAPEDLEYVTTLLLQGCTPEQKSRNPIDADRPTLKPSDPGYVEIISLNTLETI